MKKHFGLALIIILIGCVSCSDTIEDLPQIACDCVPMGFFQFDLITSDASRNSLVFGPNAPYLPSDISIFTSQDSTTFTLNQTQPGLIEGAFFYTVLTDIPERVLIEADSTDSYELLLEYTSLNMECCPGAITQMTFRDSVYLHDQGVFRLVFD